jgi:hypothetical protein
MTSCRCGFKMQCLAQEPWRATNHLLETEKHDETPEQREGVR